MAKRKKSESTSPVPLKPPVGRRGGVEVEPYYYTVQEFASGWSAQIVKYNPAGPDTLVIRKDYLANEQAACNWAIHHSNMRDYRPISRETDFHPMTEPTSPK